MSGWILGVQKLTESRGVLLWFEGGFCVTGAPRGHRGGDEGRVQGSGTQPQPAEAHLFSRSVSVTGV